MTPLSIYIHWPFCAAKCPYCDFNSRPLGEGLDEGAWARAYCAELEHYHERLGDGREVTTIYFGGGTPSLMKPQTVAAVLDKIAALWPVQQNAEITIEANPSSSEVEKFEGFKAAGVNRVSIGVQALSDADLKFLGRIHDKNAAREAIEMAQKIFDRSSFDLIYARKGQTVAGWAAELREALSFAPSHLSLYQLTIEDGTVFAKRAQHEMLQAGEEEAVRMFELTYDVLAAAGLPAYEVSNFAAKGQESRHNLTYWNYGEYIGIGPGAHGRFVQNAARFAAENHSRPEAWLQQVTAQGHGRSVLEEIDTATAQREALMMGLRLVRGIDELAWLEKFDTPIADFVQQEKLQTLIDQGFMKREGGFVATTPAGLQRLNAVLGYLV